MTGPRKRTFQLLGLFSLGLFLTTGGPAHSARSRRYHYWYGTRSRRNYSTSVKRARTQTNQDRGKRSTRQARVKSLAQRAAWLKQRSTQSNRVSTLRASRGLTGSLTDRRSSSGLKAALARRQAWIGDSPQPFDPSATDNRVAGPLGEAGPPAADGADDSGTKLAPGYDPEPGAEAASGNPDDDSPAARREQALVRDALTARGTRYRWGGSSRGGFDCSGFTRYVMARNLGILLPHSASAQSHYGQKVALEQLKEGDLVFFRTYRRGISHVGIYVGNNQFIHAPRTGRSVSVEPLTGYYRRRFVTARRLVKAAPPS